MKATDIEELFTDAGVDGFLHVVDLHTGREITHQADSFVIPASVFKVPVLLELFRQHDEGELDAGSPVSIPPGSRTPGPYGLSVMRDQMTASLRDLAWLMIGVSDNTATDIICAHVGLANVTSTLRSLGLDLTTITEDCRALISGMCSDLGVASLADVSLPVTAEALQELRSHDPARADTRTTPREMTRLLELIWTDRAASPAVCAEVRRILALQVWPHRLASGFADLDEVSTSGKTGTLFGICNEIGVVQYPDGGQFAVACFTRSEVHRAKTAAADAVIGRSARAAIELLRGTGVESLSS